MSLDKFHEFFQSWVTKETVTVEELQSHFKEVYGNTTLTDMESIRLWNYISYLCNKYPHKEYDFLKFVEDFQYILERMDEEKQKQGPGITLVFL